MKQLTIACLFTFYEHVRRRAAFQDAAGTEAWRRCVCVRERERERERERQVKRSGATDRAQGQWPSKWYKMWGKPVRT